MDDYSFEVAKERLKEGKGPVDGNYWKHEEPLDEDDPMPGQGKHALPSMLMTVHVNDTIIDRRACLASATNSLDTLVSCTSAMLTAYGIVLASHADPLLPLWLRCVRCRSPTTSCRSIPNFRILESLMRKSRRRRW